jgi:Protein of unknwon function (DUF3310)
MDSKKMNKSARIREQLAKGLTSDAEIAAIVGCTKTLVSVVKSGYKRDQQKLARTKKKRFLSHQLALKAKPLTAKDMVNDPPHYTEGGINTYDYIVAKGLSYELGNVVKYVSRAGRKGDKLEDLKKAQWYLTAAIIREELIDDALGEVV